MQCALILLAGGQSRRMEKVTSDKILASLQGIPVFTRVWNAFAPLERLQTVIVYRDDDQKSALSNCIPNSANPTWVRGGKERSDSVRAGLKTLLPEVESVLIHDSARPWVRSEEILQVAEALKTHPAVSLAHRVVDTIRQVQGDPSLTSLHSKTLDRSTLWAMETPQGFHRFILDQAYASTEENFTDDLALIESVGFPVFFVENNHPNFKLTRASDLEWLPQP